MVLLIDSVFLFERYMSYAVPFFHEVAYQLGSFLRIHLVIDNIQFLDDGFFLFQIFLLYAAL